MFWFKDKKRMEFIQSFRPTSKAQLLQVAMWYHKGDTKKAQEMVDFYLHNMSLPETDPVPPTWIDQAKNVLGWMRENQDELMQGYNILHYMLNNKGALPTIESTPPATELPPINE